MAPIDSDKGKLPVKDISAVPKGTAASKIKYISPDLAKEINSELDYNGIDAKDPKRDTYYQLAAKLTQENASPKLSGELVGKSYKGLIDKMLDAQCSLKSIQAYLSDSEENISRMTTMGFDNVGVDASSIRKWMIKLTESQISKGTIRPDGPGMLNKVMINQEDFKQLLEENHLVSITREAFDAYFGNQDHNYNAEEDKVSINRFVDKMQNEVLPLASSMVGPSNSFYQMLRMFKAEKILVMDPKDFGSYIKDRFQKVLIENINSKFPIDLQSIKANNPKLTDAQAQKTLADNKKMNEKLQQELNSILQDFDYGKLINHPKDPNANHFNYLEGIEKSTLVVSLALLKEAANDPNSTEETKNLAKGDNLYAYGGLKALMGESEEVSSIMNQYIMQGGKADDFYEINIANKTVANALMTTVVDYGLGKQVPTYGHAANLKEYIQWVKNKSQELTGKKAISQEDYDKLSPDQKEKETADELGAVLSAEPIVKHPVTGSTIASPSNK